MKRTIVLLLALALVLTALPCGVFADETDQYFAGKGTKDEPYLIQTPADLATLVYLTTDYDNGYYDTSADYTIPGTTTVWPASGAFGKAGYYCGRYSSPSAIRYYKMTADLDMTGYDFNKGGIGEGMDFRGSFDGDGHVIKNWTSTSSGGKQNNGIFAVAGFGNVSGQGIRNVGVENASVTSDKFISGVLVGYLSSIGTVEDVAVENCYVKNSSSKIMTRDTAPSNGGVVGCLKFESGSATSITVKNCYAEGISLLNSDGADGRQPDYAGIVARIWHNWKKDNKAYISNCYSLGTTTNDYLQPVGAVPGNNTTASFEYTDCYSLSANGSAVWSKWATDSANNAPSVSETNLSAPTAASFTGGTFVDDVLELNGGLPVFSWEYTYITNTLAATENGTLDVAEETGLVKKSGNTVYIKTGADLTVTAEPSENYTLSDVKYGGEDKTSAFGISGSAKFAFSDLTDNGVWSAEFKENAAEPSIVADKAVVMSTYGDGNAPAAVAYAKFSGLNPFEYGMVITRTSDGKALTLKAADNKNGAYAIKVYGEGVNEGNFTMKPYYVADEGSSAAYGDETDSFTLE